MVGKWSLFGASEPFADHAAQSCCCELQNFRMMALKATPNILESLCSPTVEKVPPLGEKLLTLPINMNFETRTRGRRKRVVSGH